MCQEVATVRRSWSPTSEKLLTARDLVVTVSAASAGARWLRPAALAVARVLSRVPLVSGVLGGAALLWLVGALCGSTPAHEVAVASAQVRTVAQVRAVPSVESGAQMLSDYSGNGAASACDGSGV